MRSLIESALSSFKQRIKTFFNKTPVNLKHKTALGWKRAVECWNQLCQTFIHYNHKKATLSCHVHEHNHKIKKFINRVFTKLIIMKISPVALGTFLLILGLISCQFGLLLVLHQASFMALILGILPFELVEILGAVLQLLGSFLIVFGIVSLVNGITVEVTEDQTYRLSETLLRIEERVRELNIQRTQLTSICKFCGAPIEDETVFCPSCGKSQK